MKQLLFILCLFFSVNSVAYPHFIHHYHHSSVSRTRYIPHHQSKSSSTKVRSSKIVRDHRHTKVVKTFQHNGMIYFIILHPKKGHVYNNDLVLCEGCGKVLVKRNVKYCHKCMKKRIRY